MLEQILSFKFVAKAFTILSAVLNYMHINISELNHVKLLALVLIISALIIFIFLIIIVVLNNLTRLFGRNHIVSSGGSSTFYPDSPFSAEEQEELELELQKELELALSQREELEQKKRYEQKSIEKSNRKQKNEYIDKTGSKEDTPPSQNIPSKHLPVDIDFDWQKQKNLSGNTQIKIDSSMLSYTQQSSKLSSLTGLIVDMLGRDIDELKIAQTLNYKTKGLSNENDILKLIDAVKYFIKLCQTDKFSQLDNSTELPTEKQALYHLANNDPTPALALLENLMDKTIDKATNATESKKKQILSEVSEHACCLGALAESNNLMLATSIYEMAVELNSNNATAWSRLGDVYRIANSESKAIWAYQNAYSFADAEINPAELANASQSMSGYLYNQGNNLQAAKMHNIAKQYYDSLAINKSFSNKEIEAIEIIENNRQQNIPTTINKLLQHSRNF